MTAQPAVGPTFVEVERADVIVMFVQVPDTVPEIQEGMQRLESVVGELRGRRFFGTVHPENSTYRACVQQRDGDRPKNLGLETGTVPGGRYLRARLQGEPPELYERIAPTAALLEQAATWDTSRPLIEYYRRRNQVDVLMPV